eukprot:14948850-Alexandrium_andersonii.AAC.1
MQATAACGQSPTPVGCTEGLPRGASWKPGACATSVGVPHVRSTPVRQSVGVPVPVRHSVGVRA